MTYSSRDQANAKMNAPPGEPLRVCSQANEECHCSSVATPDADTGAFLSDALNHIAMGIAIVGADLDLRYANVAARAALNSRRGVTVLKGTVRFEDTTAQGQLERAVARISRLRYRPRRQCADVIAIDDDRARSPLQVCVAPLTDVTGTHVTAALFIYDPERAASDSTAILRRLYNLTRSEAKLMSPFVNGATLGETAAALGLSINTVRTQLKEVFRKTGARRQSDLMRIVIRGLATLDLEV